jgi:predicted Zn-dependent peptidase
LCPKRFWPRWKKWEKALKGIRQQIATVLNEPLSTKELDRAKQYWIGRYELDLQRYGAQAMVAVLDETYGLGFDHGERVVEFIQSVTAEEIRKAAQEVFQIGAPVISLVHSEEISKERILDAWSIPS